MDTAKVSANPASQPPIGTETRHYDSRHEQNHKTSHRQKSKGVEKLVGVSRYILNHGLPQGF